MYGLHALTSCGKVKHMALGILMLGKVKHLALNIDAYIWREFILPVAFKISVAQAFIDLCE